MSRNAHPEFFSRECAPALRLGRHGLVSLFLMGGMACGGDGPGVVEPPPPPEPGAIQLTVETLGFLKDDGYEVLLNGESQGTVAASDQMTISDLDAATYQVGLGDVADNCAVEAGSVAVAAGQTAMLTLSVSCAHGPATAYEGLRASRDRPNLENGQIIQCSFGLCPSDSEWDMYVEFDSQSEPQAVVRQNQTTVVEIAYLSGVAFAELTEEDFTQATFTTEFVEEPLSSTSVVLLRTDQGNVYALGNPIVATGFTPTLTVEAALIAVPES